MVDAALAFYRKCRKLAPKRSDMFLHEVAEAAQRSLRLMPEERRGILNGIADITKGRVTCPKCGSAGPHDTSVAPWSCRVSRIAHSCADCGASFKTTEVTQ